MSEIRFWKAVLSILALGFMLVFVFHVWSVLLPFIFGLVIAYLINPIVDRFVSQGLRRDRVVLVLYVIFLAIGLMLGNWLLPTLYQEANQALSNLPAYATALNEVVQNINKQAQSFLAPYIGEHSKNLAISFNAENLIETLFYKLPENILNVAHFGMWIFIVPFVSFFALSQGQKWIDQIFSLTPSEYVESLLGLLAEVNATLGGYVRGVLLESTCVGFLTILGLWAIGIKGALLLGFVTALLNVIPFMALFVGGGIAMLAGYFQTGSLSVVVGILVLYGVVRIIDDIVIIPFVMGQTVQLHPVIILFAILAGVELGGFVGLLFAIPLAAVAKVVLSLILRSRDDGLISVEQHVYS